MTPVQRRKEKCIFTGGREKNQFLTCVCVKKIIFFETASSYTYSTVEVVICSQLGIGINYQAIKGRTNSIYHLKKVRVIVLTPRNIRIKCDCTDVNISKFGKLNIFWKLASAQCARHKRIIALRANWDHCCGKTHATAGRRLRLGFYCTPLLHIFSNIRLVSNRSTRWLSLLYSQNMSRILSILLLLLLLCISLFNLACDCLLAGPVISCIHLYI